MAASTTLPKLPPSRGKTPVATPIHSIHAPALTTRRPSTTYVSPLYGTYPPIDLTRRSDSAVIPKRINPLAPPPPKRRMNHSLETQDAHYHNEQRVLLMKQRDHYRYHSHWAKAFYGSPAEKEQYRKNTRDVLKQQMIDRSRTEFWEKKDRQCESKIAAALDNNVLQKDADDFINKFSYLNTFTKQNKELMEETWDKRRFNKRRTDSYDSEQMRFNPINWSKSLS